MATTVRNPKNLIAGTVFLAAGGAFAAVSLTFHMGSLTHMGPGYFPTALGILLSILGLAIIVTAFTGEMSGAPGLAWRPLVFVLAGIGLFALLLRGAGLVPAIGVLVGVALLALRRTSLLFAIGLASLLSLFCYAVFIRGLQLPLDAFGPWFGG